MSEKTWVEELTTEACWKKLRDAEFGRLAFVVVDEVHILPINFAVKEDKLYFLTAEGTKLLGVVMGAPVAFEIDEYDEDAATSVVVRGTARLLPEDEAHLADDLVSLPWVLPETPKYNVVCIDPTVVTGRRFGRV